MLSSTDVAKGARWKRYQSSKAVCNIIGNLRSPPEHSPKRAAVLACFAIPSLTSLLQLLAMSAMSGVPFSMLVQYRMCLTILDASCIQKCKTTGAGCIISRDKLSGDSGTRFEVLVISGYSRHSSPLVECDGMISSCFWVLYWHMRLLIPFF